MAAALVALAGVECADPEGSLGAPCIKGEECASGVCSDQVCVPAPPALEGTPPPFTPEASSDDAPVDGSAAVEASDDTSAPAETSTMDAPTDATGHLDQASADRSAPKDAKGGGG